MSGHCDFCECWHSGPCCHPGRYKRRYKQTSFFDDNFARDSFGMAPAKKDDYTEALIAWAENEFEWQYYLEHGTMSGDAHWKLECQKEPLFQALIVEYKKKHNL